MPAYNFLFSPSNPPTSSYPVWNNLPEGYDSSNQFYPQNPSSFNDPILNQLQQVTCAGDVLTSATTEVTCTRNRNKIPCSSHLYPGDLAHIRCKTGYTTTHHLIKSDLQCLSSGRWSSPVFECVADCGRVTKKAKV